MEPVVCDPSDPSALTEADLPILKEQYEILAKEMIKRNREGRGFTFYHYMIDLTGGPCIYKRISGCGSGTEYMAVTPWGDLYPCHQFVGDPKYLMGDIWKGVTNTAVRDEFKHCNAYAARSARTAGQSSTAPAAVRPTPTTQPAALPACTSTAVSCSASGWSAPL